MSGLEENDENIASISDIDKDKIDHVEGKFEPSARECPKVEAESDSGDLPIKASNSVQQKKEVEMASELLSLPDARETAMRSDTVNESDESDIVEHDVKVCDICGDAGREDLLAVCCSCSEGAEHTYCMREMLDKIPEGDWLCEDCKFEERKAQEKPKYNTVDGDEPDGIHRSPGQNVGLSEKLNGLDTDVDSIKAETDTSHLKLSRKRKADDAEVSSVAKRQVLESTVRSPRTSSPRRVDVLSRDSSFKNLDRGKVKPALDGKVKPAHQVPTTLQTGNTATEVAGPLDARLHTSRGNLFKSKSFSSASTKPKVKLVDELVPQTQKSNREAAPLDTKGGLCSSMTKSMSFRSVKSGRLNSADSKVKMLSPKFPHAQDIKGQKHTKERSFFERKSSIRLERPLINSKSTVASSTSSSPRIDRNLSVRDETVPLSTSSNRELKAVHSDSKSTQFSRPANKVIGKGLEVSIPSGEVTRQLSSAGGISNRVEKSTQARLKDDCSSTSLSTERQVSKISGGITDQARESKNVVENVKENSISNPKQISIAGGKVTPCQKCKDVGHSAEVCTIDSPKQSLASDVLTSRSSKEAIHKDNSLKAAIEAALLKKPGIYRKNKVHDQSAGIAVSGNINSEVCSQDQQSNTHNPRKLVPGEEVSKEGASGWNFNTEFPKLTNSTNVKQFTNSAEAVTALSHRPIPHGDGKSSTMDLPSSASLSISVLSIMPAIPEHEYIWQGCFEVQRSGKLPDRYNGFQAHLSACASPRVLETVNKFPRTVLLNEVPRWSAWPIQFEETGVSEDHIALYFFARDCESYEKGYKSILDSIMRNDLALKGNVDGVEILIYSSNQLPVKYQRWNMMFFLWGVFRGKRNSCSKQVLGSPKKIASSRDLSIASMSSTENISSLLSVEKDLPTCNKAQKNDCANSTKEQGSGLDCKSVPTNQMKPPQAWPDTKSRTTLLEGPVDQDCKVVKEPKSSAQVASRSSCFNTSDEKKTGRRSTRFDIPPLTSIQCTGEVNNKEQLIPKNLKIDGLLEAEAMAEKGAVKLSSTKELHSWPSSHRKRSIFDPPVSESEATYVGSNLPMHGISRNRRFDNEDISKKQKLDYSDLYGLSDRTSSSRDVSQIQDSASSFLKKRYDEGSNETSISQTPGNAERYFFPVDPHHLKHIDSGTSSILGKTALSVDEEPHKDKIPNLNLALGDDAQTENHDQDQPSGRTVITSEEDASAALSLSLAFPFADKEQAGQPVSTKELLPSGRQQEIFSSMASLLASLPISGALPPKSRDCLFTKTNLHGSTVPLTFQRKLNQPKTKRSLSVCAEYDDQRGGSGGDFVAGFLIGGALFGTLGYLFAPQIRRSLLNEDEYGFRRAKRPIYYDEGLEKTRETLNTKISQLNSAIDNVSTRLRGGKTTPPVPVENEADEATM
ncbi:PHD-type domain-containing protein [Heracleum sosnowskyi]|uniref:PHD-type domain-containing protein n=1 Tax=Heracleum sosnowskyi TaxID=360622 RepID=A0AAD8MW98_9APIA|nr:PHD-type domain-containing protein [Heracleum sosnowskyi]